MLNLDVHLNYTNDDEYRDQLLQLFSMDTFNEDKINDDIHNLATTLVEIDKFKELFTFCASQLLSVDLEVGLMILFSYDYLKDFIEGLNLYYKNDYSGIDKLIKKIKK